ncbi:MAG: lysophospholipid acyltransferase family protein [Elusimicrobiota bacterium]
MESRVSRLSDPHRIPYRGPVFHFFWPFTRYIIVNGCAFIFWFYFNVLNKTIVVGAGNVPEDDNTLILPNHQTMFDGFLVGAAAFYPKCFWKPWLFPWIPAAQENFYSNPFWGWVSDNWKCIPVREGRKDFRAMKRIINCLKHGRMIVFPEGTRSRTGEIGPARLGMGYVILHTFPKTIPVCMVGVDKVLPVGSWWPRIFKTVYLYFGKPVALDEFRGMDADREGSEQVINKVFDQVHRQDRILKRYRRLRARRLVDMPFFYSLYGV